MLTLSDDMGFNYQDSDFQGQVFVGKISHQERTHEDWLLRCKETNRIVVLDQSRGGEYRKGDEVRFKISAATDRADVSFRGSYSLVDDSSAPTVELLLHDSATEDTLVVGSGNIGILASGRWYSHEGTLGERRYTLGKNNRLPGFLIAMTKHLDSAHFVQTEFPSRGNHSLLWYASAPSDCEHRQSLEKYVNLLLSESI